MTMMMMMMIILVMMLVFNENHVLHKLLPERSTHDYKLRPRYHDSSLNLRTDNKNFFQVECYSKTYAIHFITRCIHLFQCTFFEFCNRMFYSTVPCTSLEPTDNMYMTIGANV